MRKKRKRKMKRKRMRKIKHLRRKEDPPNEEAMSYKVSQDLQGKLCKFVNL
jgi:hypothetical protein